MSLYITSLNSGSNGNCYYIGNEEDAVLIDAGLSCKETEKRMHLLGLSFKKIRGIVISHEHIDHVKGLPQIATKYQLPVYVTQQTAATIFLKNVACFEFIASKPLTLASLTITAFRKHHDAIDPHSFVVSYNGINIGVFTDIGVCCDELAHHFKQCHAAFLESNYDDVLLERGRYPWHLKNRIRGGKGHLSNRQALEVFTRHRPPFMSHLLLAHLSHDNNDPVLVKQLFSDHAGNTNISIASRYEASPIFTITNNFQQAASKPLPVHLFRPSQLSLF